MATHPTLAATGTPLVGIADIEAAAIRIRGVCLHTPVVALATPEPRALRVKAESLQPTGAFKLRGATNAVRSLPDPLRRRGVVTHSSGNHGQALAYAARSAGIPCTVVMPEGASPVKVAATRRWGARIVSVPVAERATACADIAARTGAIEVPPYDSAAIIAGQGTVGLEILEDVPDVETIVVPVGGGGLISGIALAVKSQRPDVRVVGVEPEGANIVKRSLESGKPEAAMTISTIADGLAAPFAGELSQAVIVHYVDDVVLVTDDEIVQALRLVLERAKVLVEPAGAASLAALLTGKAGVRTGGRTVAVLSGGNVDRAKLKTLL